MEEIERQKSQQDSTEVVVSQPEQTEPVIAQADSSQVSESIDTNTVVQEVPEELVELSNNLLKLSITNKGGHIQEVELLDYKRYDSTDLILFEEDQHRFAFEVPLKSSLFYSNDLTYQVGEKTDSSLTMVATHQGVTVTHYYGMTGGYQLDYRFMVDDPNKLLSTNNPYITLNWSQELQPQEKSVEKERTFSDIYYKYKGSNDPDNVGAAGSETEDLTTDLHWVSFKQKFFNSTIIFNQPTTDDGTNVDIEEPEEFVTSYVEVHKAEIPFEIPRAGSPAFDFTMYYGPNHYQTLKAMDVELEEIIPLGWGILSWVNKFAVIPIFNWLDDYFSNYGLIILIMTIIIKLVLFLPMYKVYVSTAKMRLLKPELDELKEKTGGDMAKMQQEQMKLYKQAGVNPLGGCLPQLVQLPILIALFRFFPASIELRQESLWWADDLSTYDSILNLPFEIPFYGDHVSLFTLLMTAVTLLYTWMNSQISGANNPSMKVVMYLMPIMFLGFFNNYAAALSYYYLLSTSITIIQNFVIRKFIIDEDKLHAQIQANKKKKVKVKKSGLMKRLEDSAKKRGIDPYSGKKK
jgi:YidC/Oxa1 family membrane protein insertase